MNDYRPPSQHPIQPDPRRLIQSRLSVLESELRICRREVEREAHAALLRDALIVILGLLIGLAIVVSAFRPVAPAMPSQRPAIETLTND